MYDQICPVSKISGILQGVYTKPAHIGSLLVFLSPVFDETRQNWQLLVCHHPNVSYCTCCAVLVEDLACHRLFAAATEPHQADTPSVEPADESQSEPVQHATAATAERSGLIGPCMPQHASSPSALGDDNDTFAAGPQGPSAADSNGQQPANSMPHLLVLRVLTPYACHGAWLSQTPLLSMLDCKFVAI